LDGGEFRNCRFEIGGNGVGLTCGYTESLDVVGCVFNGFGLAFTEGFGVGRVSFSDCTFSGNRIAMFYGAGSYGSIRNTTITDALEVGLVVSYNALPMDLSGVRIVGGQWGLQADGGAGVRGVNVIIQDTTIEAVEIGSDDYTVVSFNNSHFLPATGKAVKLHGYPGQQFELDFTGNYWGTTNPDSIAALIYDGQDDPNIHCTVRYSPFANGPVPTEKKSFGSVKSMFR